MSQGTLPTSLTPAEWLSFGVSAISNAYSLAGDARLLAGHQRWNCATALMVTSVEEGGKGSCAVLHALGLLEWTKTEKELIQLLLKNHHRKQALGAALVAAACALQKWPGRRTDSQPYSEMEGAVRGLLYFGSLLREIVDQGRKVDVSRYQPRSVLEVLQGLSHGLGTEGRFDFLRQRALYVAFNEADRKVSRPDSIGEAEYESVALWFKWSERVLHVLHRFGTSEAVQSEMQTMVAMYHEEARMDRQERRIGG